MINNLYKSIISFTPNCILLVLLVMIVRYFCKNNSKSFFIEKLLFIRLLFPSHLPLRIGLNNNLNVTKNTIIPTVLDGINKVENITKII